MSSRYQTLGKGLLQESEYGNVGRVQALLKDGADPGFKDEYGNTAAHFAANREVLDALIEAATLPPGLEDHMEINDVHPSGQCWTYTVSDSLRADAVPLSMYGIPIVIPVQSPWSRESPSTSSDAYSKTIDPTAHIAEDIVQKIFDTYKGALGFYLLINGDLQIIVPNKTDYDQAISEHPRRFGGLKVSYITQSLTPTANQQAPLSSDTTSGAALSQGSIERTVHAAHRKNLNRKARPSASIGVMTEREKKRYLTIPTHFVTSAWMEYHKSRTFRRPFQPKKPLPGDESWLNKVQIFSSTGSQLGRVVKTFDSEPLPFPDDFPQEFSYDISLVDVTEENGSLFSNIEAPMSINWLPQHKWNVFKYDTKYLFLLNRASPSGSNFKSIQLTDPQYQAVGQGIFKPRPKGKEEDLNTSTHLARRALLFRTEGPPVESGMAVCLQDEGNAAKVAGFTAFSQGGEAKNSTSLGIGNDLVFEKMRSGTIHFYGAFKVPEELMKHTILFSQ